ncbi:MAG: enoyl-CoA hydratase-related protein, partial [Candidatus Methylomirabilia bacterium]
MSEEIVVRQDGGIATVTFNRPAMRNAISLAMWREIAQVAEGLGKDDSVRAVVFRGAGAEAFASGADISEFKEVRKDKASAQAYNKETDAAYRAVRRCPKATVAMIYGFCMGGGMALAMACDLRFSAEGAKFGIPAARLGIVYSLESTRHLVALVGPAYAKDILCSARTVEAQEARAIGFLNRLLPAHELEPYTYDYVRKVAANAPLSVRGAKLAVQASVEDKAGDLQEEIHRLGLEAFDS